MGGVAIMVAAAAFATDYPLELPDDFILVAHRGVVTDTIRENSLASLEETIRRGYTHVEVDLRVTADGHVVCFHDDNLKRVLDIDATISKLTLAELRENAPEEAVPSFETFCATCEGRIDLMPDVKGCPRPLIDTYAKGIEQPMVSHGLMKNALFIGRPEVITRFREKARMAWRSPLSKSKGGRLPGENPGKDYFAFNHGKDFDLDEIRGFQAMGLAVVVSINLYHYKTANPLASGQEDIKRLVELDVDGLQIDTAYESAVVEALAARK